MTHVQLTNQLDDDRILAAIAAAEAATTAYVRVMISKRAYRDPLAGAIKHFKALKLDRPPHGNAVLIFIAPRSQTFAIYADSVTQAQLGPAIWNVLRDEMGNHLKGSRFTEAIVQTIAKLGDLLAIHFPR